MVLAPGAAGLAAVLAVAVLLTGCSRQGCGSGTDSAVDAVTGMLRAAEKGARDEVCRFVPESAGQVDQAVHRYTVLRQAIARAGGIDRLALRVDPSRQMGAEHTVLVSSAGSALAEFSVIGQSGRFLVYPEAIPPSP